MQSWSGGTGESHKGPLPWGPLRAPTGQGLTGPEEMGERHGDVALAAFLAIYLGIYFLVESEVRGSSSSHLHNSLSNPFSLDSPKTQVDSQQIGKRKRVRELEAILEQSSNFGSL